MHELQFRDPAGLSLRLGGLDAVCRSSVRAMLMAYVTALAAGLRSEGGRPYVWVRQLAATLRGQIDLAAPKCLAGPEAEHRHGLGALGKQLAYTLSRALHSADGDDAGLARTVLLELDWRFASRQQAVAELKRLAEPNMSPLRASDLSKLERRGGGVSLQRLSCALRSLGLGLQAAPTNRPPTLAWVPQPAARAPSQAPPNDLHTESADQATIPIQLKNALQRGIEASKSCEPYVVLSAPNSNPAPDKLIGVLPWARAPDELESSLAKLAALHGWEFHGMVQRSVLSSVAGPSSGSTLFAISALDVGSPLVQGWNCLLWSSLPGQYAGQESAFISPRDDPSLDEFSSWTSDLEELHRASGIAEPHDIMDLLTLAPLLSPSGSTAAPTPAPIALGNVGIIRAIQFLVVAYRADFNCQIGESGRPHQLALSEQDQGAGRWNLTTTEAWLEDDRSTPADSMRAHESITWEEFLRCMVAEKRLPIPTPTVFFWRQIRAFSLEGELTLQRIEIVLEEDCHRAQPLADQEDPEELRAEPAATPPPLGGDVIRVSGWVVEIGVDEEGRPSPDHSDVRAVRLSIVSPLTMYVSDWEPA